MLAVPCQDHDTADEMTQKILEYGAHEITYYSTMGMLTMAYDHRIVDGADADRFLADVKRLLQEFPEGAV